MPLWFVALPIGMAAVLAWIVRRERRRLAAVERLPVPVIEA